MTLRPLGIAIGWIINIVLVPLMRPPTPCASRPKLFASAHTQVVESGPRDRARYVEVTADEVKDDVELVGRRELFVLFGWQTLERAAAWRMAS